MVIAVIINANRQYWSDDHDGNRNRSSDNSSNSSNTSSISDNNNNNSSSRSSSCVIITLSPILITEKACSWAYNHERIVQSLHAEITTKSDPICRT